MTGKKQSSEQTTKHFQESSVRSGKFLRYLGMITTILYVVCIPAFDIAYKVAHESGRNNWAPKSTLVYYSFYIPVILFASIWATGEVLLEQKGEDGNNWRGYMVGLTATIIIISVAAYYLASIFFGVHYRLMNLH